MTFDVNKIEKIGLVLKDRKRPLKERFRALFTLKNIGGEVAIKYISNVFDDPSALLKHELAYCLGQMKDERAIPILTDILKDSCQEPIVRHEAGEALGAIGSSEALPVLNEYLNSPIREISETCYLAINKIALLQKVDKENSSTVFNSVDPAPPLDQQDIKILEKTFLDENADLFERYRAMFALRNINTEESIKILCKGLNLSGALFRHEVAFVLGQIESEISVPYLIAALEDKTQSGMVRHECAEALGAISSAECISILNKYKTDSCQVVQESCDIALDMADYNLSEEFQYANTADKVS